MTAAGVVPGLASSRNVSQSRYVVPSEKYHAVDRRPVRVEELHRQLRVLIARVQHHQAGRERILGALREVQVRGQRRRSLLGVRAVAVVAPLDLALDEQRHAVERRDDRRDRSVGDLRGEVRQVVHLSADGRQQEREGVPLAAARVQVHLHIGGLAGRVGDEHPGPQEGVLRALGEVVGHLRRRRDIDAHRAGDGVARQRAVGRADAHAAVTGRRWSGGVGVRHRAEHRLPLRHGGRARQRQDAGRAVERSGDAVHRRERQHVLASHEAAAHADRRRGERAARSGRDGDAAIDDRRPITLREADHADRCGERRPRRRARQQRRVGHRDGYAEACDWIDIRHEERLSRNCQHGPVVVGAGSGRGGQWQGSAEHARRGTGLDDRDRLLLARVGGDWRAERDRRAIEGGYRGSRATAWRVAVITTAAVVATS